MRPAALAAAILLAQPIFPRLALDVSALTPGAPVTVATLDTERLKGDLRQLAWSPDDSELYVRVGDGGTPEAVHHYVITRQNGAVASVEYPPEWGVHAWAMKSDLAAPGFPALKIEVLEEHQRTRPAPFSGGFGPNGGQTNTDPHNPNDTFGIEVRLTLLGEEVGYFMNEVAMAGVTYGWGPSGSGAIAYVDAKGQLFLFDRDKHKQRVRGTKNARLPAWSSDGSMIAFAQKAGRKQYAVVVIRL